MAECLRSFGIPLSPGVCTQILLGDATLPQDAEFGRSLSITYTVEDGKKQADTIELVPDWLLDWMATSECQLWN